MGRGHRFFIVRDAIVATVVIAGLYALAISVQSSLFQIPGYLLIVGFDLLELIFGSAGSSYHVLFAVYLLGLGLVSAIVSHTIRGIARDTDVPSWRLGMAGALTVVGGLSLLFALSIFLGTSQREPVLITGTTGLFMLALAGWLVGLFDI